MRRNETKYVLLELLSMAFLAASGIFVRYSVISPINAGMWRCLFALPVLYLMCRSELPALTKKDWLMLLAAGVMLAGDVALYNTAFSYTSVANATLIVNLTPFVIVPVSRFVFKESVPRHFLIGAAVAVAGLVLLRGRSPALRGICSPWRPACFTRRTYCLPIAPAAAYPPAP